MELSRQTKKNLMQVIAFAVLLYCGIEHFDVVVSGTGFVLEILMPFFVGGVIAFIFHVPMKVLEKHLFQKNQKMKKWRRPIAYLLTLLAVIGIIALVLLVVIPELGKTVSVIVAQIPQAFDTAAEWVDAMLQQYPALEPAVAEWNIDWSTVSSAVVKFIQSVASGLVSSGVGIFSGIVSGVATFVIAFTFSIYLLFQKERLGRQGKQVLSALLPEKVADKILEMGVLSDRIFSSFLSGQCLEAVILGTLFVICMSLFRMPYAMLIGVVIAVMALIPIFGAFIGCVVGMLLIVMVNPIQAVWFLILFLVLQQLEGNLIYPHVVGGSIGLPSIWVLVAVTVGGKLFGIAGILFFIPFCSVLYALFRDFIKERLKKKSTKQIENK